MSVGAIVSKGGWARQLIPFYGFDQVAVFFISIGGIWVTTLLLGYDFNLSALGGALGALAWMNYRSRPAYLAVDADLVPTITEIISASGYRYETSSDRWISPRPRWMRWSSDFVQIERQGAGARVHAQADLLRDLVKIFRSPPMVHGAAS